MKPFTNESLDLLQVCLNRAKDSASLLIHNKLSMLMDQMVDEFRKK